MVRLDGSEHISRCNKLTVDEAKKKLRLGGDKAEAFEKRVLERQDGQFKDLMSVVFGWKLQEDGGKKLVSKMPSGKILFPDRSENLEEIEPGAPYMCLVFDRQVDEKGDPGKEAFAKVICREYKPKIYIHPSGMPVMVWYEDNGKMRNMLPKADSYAGRMMILINMAEKKGFPSVDLVFRKNQRVEYLGEM